MKVFGTTKQADGSERTVFYDVTTGEAAGYQTRTPEGSKKNQTGASTKTAVFVPTDVASLTHILETANPVVLCEGLSDTETLLDIGEYVSSDLTPLGVISASTFPTVVESLDSTLPPERGLILIPDTDRAGYDGAISAFVRCKNRRPRIVLPEDKPNKDLRDVWSELSEPDRKRYAKSFESLCIFPVGDVSTIVYEQSYDTHLEGAVENMLKAALSASHKQSPIKRRSYYDGRRTKIPPVVIGAFGIRKGFVCAMVGPPASGKSAIALAASLEMTTTDRDTYKTYANSPLLGGDVLWLAAEGEFSMQTRVAAWNERYNPADKWPDGFGVLTPNDVVRYGPSNTEVQEAQLSKLADICEKEQFYPKLVVLDTLAASLANSDLEENSAKGMNAATNWAKQLSTSLELGDEYGPAVLMVHHTGKDTEKGARGHSSFNAALDVELRISNDKLNNSAAANEPVLRFAKHRFESMQGVHRFRLEGGGPVDPGTRKPQGVRAVYIWSAE